MALEKKHYREAIRIIRTSKVDSHAIIGYLQRNGFEDIALYFVTEPRARFNLAIRCGNLDIAQECATQLDEASIWRELAEEALRQGNYAIVETCYQQTKSFEKLSFLYVVTGNRAKLEKMLKIAELRQDMMSRFFNAMYLGDVRARVKVLLDVNQTTLAYITAVSYGLEEEANSIRALLEEQKLPVPDVAPATTLLTPPTAVEQEGEYPLLEMPRSVFDRVMEEEARGEPEVTAEQTLEEEFKSVGEEEEESSEAKNEWDDDLGFSDNGETGWGDDLDLSDEETVPMKQEEEKECPSAGADVATQWCQHSSLAYDHACAGNVDSACQLLNRQIGLKDVKVLSDILRSCYLSVQAVSVGYPSMPALSVPLQRSTSPSLPLSVYRLQHAVQLVKMGLKCFQAGRFEDTLNAFKSLLVIVPMVLVDSKEDEAELKQFVEMAREYIMAVQIELTRRETPAGSPRNLALSAFMTQCKLQNPHVLLTLNSAMVAAFKAENFIDAAGFANRILMNPEIKSPRNAPLEQKARKVLQRSEREGRNSVDTGVTLDRVYVLDCATMQPMDHSAEIVKCPFCGVSYAVENKGKLCSICGMSQIGLETVGLVCMNARKCYFCFKKQRTKANSSDGDLSKFYR